MSAREVKATKVGWLVTTANEAHQGWSFWVDLNKGSSRSILTPSVRVFLVPYASPALISNIT